MSDEKRRRRRGIAGGDEAARSAQEREGGAGEERGGGWAETAKALGLAFVLFLFLRTFVLQTFYITSGSMEDTLLVGDFLVVNRAAIGGRIPFTRAHVPGYSSPRRFDVLVFDPPHTDEFRLVKRLVGMPGDTVEMRDRVVYIDGRPLDEPYLKHAPEPDEGHPSFGWQRDHLAPGVDPSTYRPTRDTWGPIVIPDGHYFMLGDNREMSLDSRYWGLLEAWRVEGRVSFIYYSYDSESYDAFPFLTEVRWGRIGDGVE